MGSPSARGQSIRRSGREQEMFGETTRPDRLRARHSCVWPECLARRRLVFRSRPAITPEHEQACYFLEPPAGTPVAAAWTSFFEMKGILMAEAGQEMTHSAHFVHSAALTPCSG